MSLGLILFVAFLWWLTSVIFYHEIYEIKKRLKMKGGLIRVKKKEG